MSHPRLVLALLTTISLAAVLARASEPAPASEADRVTGFLLRGEPGDRSFVAQDADEGRLGAVARAWAGKAEKRRVAALAAAAVPGSTVEARLAQALSRWTKDARISAENENGAAAFLENAADQAEKLLSDPAVKREVEAAAAGFDQTAALERARRAGASGPRPTKNAFGADRDPGASGGGQATGLAGNSGQTGRAENMTASSFRPAVPSKYKATAAVPPLHVVELTQADRVINGALSVVNLEAYSRKNTVNRESTEGTQAAICTHLKKANYDPGEAWSSSLAARNAPGADPGDLDLRNAEHYLYAYSTTEKPASWREGTAVQMVMALGWTPFKTVSKHVRPTSTPSFEETKWGVKGAWHGQHPPDWRKICGALR